MTSILICQRNNNWTAFKNERKIDKFQNIFQWSFAFIALVLVPLIFFLILKKYRQTYKSKEFSKSYGNLIEGMKTRKKIVVYVYPCLLINRLIFAFIPFSIWNFPSLQIMFLIFESLLYISFLAEVRINSYWLEHYQDIFNEYALLLMYTLLFYFGDNGLIFGSYTNISMDSKI